MYDFYILIAAQIIFESFPISSSGHVRLLELIGINSGIIDRMQDQMLQHFLHGPTIIILALFFSRRWVPLVARWRSAWPIVLRLIFLVAMADVITALLFCFFAWSGVSWFPIGIGFIITALLLASLRLCKPTRQQQQFKINHAIVLGLAQGIALLPGISRMAITYVVARWLRFSGRAAFELSCAIQVPLILAAFLKSVVYISCSSGAQLLRTLIIAWPTIVVIIISSIAAWFCLQLTQCLILKNTLWRVAYYMVFPFALWAALTLYC